MSGHGVMDALRIGDTRAFMGRLERAFYGWLWGRRDLVRAGYQMTRRLGMDRASGKPIMERLPTLRMITARQYRHFHRHLLENPEARRRLLARGDQ
jgi:hypothetical protein